MAFLLPENLASRSDVPQAIRDMAAALRDHTDDSVTVWLDEVQGAPYLIVFDPASGVFLVHVVEGGARGLERETGRIRKKKVAVSFSELVGHLGPEFEGIRDRLNSGAADVPLRLCIAAPRVPRQNAEKIGVAEIDSYLLREDCAPGGLPAALKRVARVGGITLTEQSERRVRAAIYPELVIHERGQSDQGLLFHPPAGGTDVIAVLDREQERLARHLGDGYRVIKGVAGSGKTLVLTFRARFLAESFPQHRVLLACYNRVLADALAHDLGDVPNVVVGTVDSLASKVCSKAGVKASGNRNEDFSRRRREALRARQQGRVDGFDFDYVLLDEAQDLGDEGTQFVYSLLGSDRDHFVVALDAAQNIYRRMTRWTPEGTSGRGRTKILRLNYRNTREILQLAYDFLMAGQSRDSTDAELDDPTVIVPPEASARRGPEPRVQQYSAGPAAMEAICDDMVRAHADGVPWDDMVVLFGHAPLRKKMYYLTKERGIPWLDVNHPGNKKLAAEATGVVRGSTIQSLKGLEYSRVYVVGIDEISAGPDTDDEVRRRLLYVGMTRATDHLMIAVTGSGPIVESLLTAAG